MKKIVLFSILIVSTLIVNADEFTYTYQGKTLKYSTLTDSTVSVCAVDNTLSDEVEIPSTVTYNGNTYSVTEIGYGAFCIFDSMAVGCTGLIGIVIPNSVTSIGKSAFSGCTSLIGITIPDGVISIGDSAFSGCTGLVSITIQNSVTSIGKCAFSNCTWLTTLRYNAVNCGGNGFSGDDEWYWLSGCNNLETVYIGDSVEVIPNYFIKKSNVRTLEIPNSVTLIGEAAFSGCTKLKRVTISNGDTPFGCMVLPDNVTSIGKKAFSDCQSLQKITIPNSVTSIGDSSFYFCVDLTIVSIGNGIVEIGEGAFASCKYIDTLYCMAVIPPDIKRNTFYNVWRGINIIVPCNSDSLYKNATYWNVFTNIQSDCPNVGLSDVDVADFSIYPNPAKESVSIEGIGEINIFNPLGQLVYSKTNNNKITTVDVSNFEKGIYFVKVGDISKKLVVQ